MSLFGKFLKIVTPYKRTYITVELEEGRETALPARNSAVCFLQRDDLFYISYESVDDLAFLDYDMIKSEKEFTSNFEVFKDHIKQLNYKNKEFVLTMTGRMINNNSIIIYLKIQ